MTRDEINEEYWCIISSLPKSNPNNADYLFARERSYAKFKELPVDEALNLLLDLSTFLEDPGGYTHDLKRLGMSPGVITETIMTSIDLKILSEKNSNSFSPRRE